MTGNGQAWLMAGKEKQDRSRWPDVPVPPPPGLGVVRAEQIHHEPQKCKQNKNKIQDWSESSTLSEASVEVEKAIRPPPGLELVRLSDVEMASLWQQWPVTDGPDADASETAAADGADDSPGGGCASTAETGASDAATQQPTEAEDQSEPQNSDAHSEKNFPEDALENPDHGDHDTAQDQVVIDHQEPPSEEAIPQEEPKKVEVQEAEEVETVEAEEAVQEDEDDEDVEGMPEDEMPEDEEDVPFEEEALSEGQEGGQDDFANDEPSDEPEGFPDELEPLNVTRDEGPRGDAKKKKKKAPKKGGNGSHGSRSRQVAVPRSRVRPPKNQKEENTKEVLKDARSRSLGPAALFLVILLVVAAMVLMAPRQKETPRGKTTGRDARSSIPDHCTAEIPSNVQLIPEGRTPPAPPTGGVLPRISLYSPCLWNNYGKAAKNWAPSALWSWRKTRPGEMEVLELQHPHERPLHILNVTGSTQKQRGQIYKAVTRNIFPKFGELNEETYGWYQAQYSTGLVVMLPDPEAHITLVKAQAQWRSTFEGLAQDYAPRYLMAYASTLDATAREWIRKEFGVTRFPAVALRSARATHWTGGAWHIFKGEITYENLRLQIQDIDAGCFTWQRPTTTFGRIKSQSERGICLA